MKRFAAGLLALLVLAGLSLPATASSITTRAGKGSALTASELDANFKQAAQTKSGNYTVVESDNRDTIEISASATITLTAAATLLAAADTGDFQITLRNTHASANVTVARSGSDTINGATSYTLYPGGSATFKINNAGNGWNVIGTANPALFPNISGPVTATQTEINYTDVTTLGTTQASKAVTTDSSGNTKFNGSFIVNSSEPLLFLNETDQGANGKEWLLRSTSGVLRLQTSNDNESGSGETIFSVTRSGNAVGTIQFDNGDVDIDENLNVDGTATLAAASVTVADITAANITVIAVSNGTIDNTSIGAITKSTGAFTTLNATGNVTLGDATSDTITATGRFASVLVPSTDTTRDLGSSSLKWRDAYIGRDLYVTGDITRTKACVTDYTRAGSGPCIFSGTLSLTSLTRDSCTHVSAPAGSHGLTIVAYAEATSGGSLANRNSTVSVYSDSGCSELRGSAAALCYEDSSTSAGRPICFATASIDVAGTTVYIKLTDDSGNAGIGNFYIGKYWDD